MTDTSTAAAAHADTAKAPSSAQMALPRGGFTWRSIIIALILIPANVYWV